MHEMDKYLILIFPTNCYIYRPQAKFRKGNVFTPVCQSFCSWGAVVCLRACWDTHPMGRHPTGQTPPRQTPPGRHPLGRHLGRHPLDRHPWADAPGQTPPSPVHADIDMATAADGTHPTGMHSCL